MRIDIEYEASWRNSFLAGSNNEPLPKNGRKFIGSMTNLKKSENYIRREVSIDTVMGILNRLIGDQRKLYQSRDATDYYFKTIEEIVSFTDVPKVINQEVAYIRNITGSTDQNSYTGMIKTDDPIFSSDYTDLFWGVLSLGLDELYQFIIHSAIVANSLKTDPLSIISRLDEINKFKPVKRENMAGEAYLVLKERFDKFNGLNKKGDIYPIAMYCSALYLQLEKLSKSGFDMDTAKTRTGRIAGISNNGFTKKDFMNRYTTGKKKKIWGNPYIRTEYVKGVGKVKHFLTKVSGTLEIEIPIDRGQGLELKTLIENAGVSSFYVGKKGLAYVSKIKV